MNNVQITDVSPIIAKAFIDLEEQNIIVNFMIGYFRNYVVVTGKPNEFSFKQCIDNISKELSAPVKKNLSGEEITEDLKKKIKTWMDSQTEFELKVAKEIVNFV